MDRLQKLARVLTRHSTRLEKGQRVLIEAFDVPPRFIEVLIHEVRQCGATPILLSKSNQIIRTIYREYTEADFQFLGELERLWMEQMHAYIGIRGNRNSCQLSDVPEENMRLLGKHVTQPVHHDIRLGLNWVVLRYPNNAMAQEAGMSTQAFHDFYFNACTMDYRRMTDAAKRLKERMEGADEVAIVGPDGTDLSFSIKGIPAVPCTGEYNIPDGECFTAPVRDSINGVIRFNAPTIYEGVKYSGVVLKFENGQIIDATAGTPTQTRKLNAVLDRDDGARYIGEFSIAFNPYVMEPILDILFDEKIDGSLHLTPGRAYKEAYNGNGSQVHWDMVLIQREEHGGGKLYFDGVLVRENGRFVTDDLTVLNPENLTKKFYRHSARGRRYRREDAK